MGEDRNAELVAGPAEAQQAHDADRRMPWQLTVVAFLFSLGGALSITEMILRPMVFGGFYVDIFGLLFIYIGWGLCRWRSAARSWAEIVTWWILFGVGIIIALCLWDLFAASPLSGRVRIGGRETGPGVGLLIGLLMGVVGIWQLRVLRMPEIVRQFNRLPLKRGLVQGRDPANSVRPSQFSLSTLFLLTIIVAFILLRVMAPDVLYATQHLTRTQNFGGVIQGVEYGIRTSRFFHQSDQLSYVVISSGSPWSGHVTRRFGTDADEAWIESPDGQRITFPSPIQLYEIVDGTLQTRSERVTVAELEDDLNSPGQWNLDSLVKHAERMHVENAALEVGQDMPP